MLLTQKPQPINFSRHHRRHPASLSTIAVAPHPTSTPGLLSLSKPIRQPSRHLQRSQSPRFPSRSRLHRPSPAPVVALVTDLSSTISSTFDPSRGRQSKVQSQRSRSASRVRLPNTPVAVVLESTTPLPFPTQQEVSSIQAPALAAQPSGRLARSRRTRHKSTPAAAVPEFNSSPEHNEVTQVPLPAKLPQPSAPIPVPVLEHRRASSPTHKLLSRSDPLSKLTIHTNLTNPLKVGRKDKRRRNKIKRTADGRLLPLAEWDFPAPGSSDDEGEGDDDEPATPIGQTGKNDRAWYLALNDGPRTAPLHLGAGQGQSSVFQFPSRASPARVRTPSPEVIPTPSNPGRQVRPHHRRAPSQPASLGRVSVPEGMFHFSDDEVEVLPAGADVREKMALLFGTGNRTGPTPSLFPSTGTPSPSPRRQRASRERESVDGVARQLFASSSFQIAPEPVELPKPTFLLGVRA